MIVPVRHHSPACARMVREAIQRVRPKAVLIEGPSDFNERAHELWLDHALPIAIYSYLAKRSGKRLGAYYPLCEFSPEWQAIQAARASRAQIRFIDLPFAAMAHEDPRAHRFADDRLRSRHFVKGLCDALEVDDFDDAWDKMVEQDGGLKWDTVRDRVSELCGTLRAGDEAAHGVRPLDRRRETFMAHHIGAAHRAFGAQRVVVVLGGYHAAGVEARLAAGASAEDATSAIPDDITERGVALTPFSYRRLDSLTGYDAGMPSPGFYDVAWRAGAGEIHQEVLGRIVRRVREMKQVASTADLVAVELCARGLSALRGHARPWRRDVIDAVTSALVKDDLTATHPFLVALHETLRGNVGGQLAPDAPLPPLVQDILGQLKDRGLAVGERRSVTVRLTDADGLATSRLLHGLRILNIPGFVREAGVDFEKRTDLTVLEEVWEVARSEHQMGAMIEAARFGSVLAEAVAAQLAERAAEAARHAAQVAGLWLDAVLAGVWRSARELSERMRAAIRQDGDLASVAQAIEHLLYLYAWDSCLGARGGSETGTVLNEAFDRALWLLELGPAPGRADEVAAIRSVRDAFERGERMGARKEGLTAALRRVQGDRARSASLRGACVGALWSIGCAEGAEVERDLRQFSDPEALGDFLVGVFGLAREEVRREPDLLQAVRRVVAGWDEGSFLEALPSLRLAFMFFTGREKVLMAQSMFGPGPPEGEPELEPLAVGVTQAARAMAFEARLFEIGRLYGVQLDEGAS